MPTESFLVATLPCSASPAADHHLSLFLTLRLTPDGASGTVGDFEHVSQWTSLVADAGITVSGRTAAGEVRTIPVTPLLDDLDPTLWGRVFPPTLTVLPWQTPDHDSREWRTFAAHRMQLHSLVNHAAAMGASPVDAPSVAGNPWASRLIQAIGGERVTSGDLGAFLDRMGDLDPEISARLDDLGTTVQGGALGDLGTSNQYGTLLAVDAHLARRFYERAEDARPAGSPPAGPVVQAPPDFHRRMSLLGDLSPLLRALGVIVDLHVSDLDALAGVVEVWAEVTVAGLDNAITAQPHTACAVNGWSFSAVSGSQDYTRGMLRLADEDRFTVLDLDPDASGLKLEQYVRNLPRMHAAEKNGDSVNSAPSALRADGFALARQDRAAALRSRLADAQGQDAGVVSGTAPPLTLEQISRGIRVEVWDDVSKAWSSLHRRLLTVDIDTAGRVLDAVPDTGFLQGAALTTSDTVADAPVYSHEVLAGWEGWSLSAPRPGLVVTHRDDGEHLDPPATPQPTPDAPVASTTEIRPGTLPRLRYGRNYAFRAWSVDLAGNSAPHTVRGPVDPVPQQPPGPAPAPAVPARLQPTALRLAQSRSALLSPDALAATSVQPVGAAGLGEIRQDLTALHGTALTAADGPKGSDAGHAQLTAVRTGSQALDALLRSRTAAATTAPPTRKQRVEQAFVSAPSDVLVTRTDTQVDPGEHAAAIGTLAADRLVAPSVDAGSALLPLLLDTVTAPRPFLRWSPVIEPAVVPRRPYSEAESLLHLVIRSGVEGPGADGVTMTVVAPETYVPAVLAAHPELDLQWATDCQRHLVAPKASQHECELHGEFDAAIGSTDPADLKQALATALRESGTLMDTTVASLDTPGQRDPVTGISLVTAPTADEPSPPIDLDTRDRGSTIGRGQYVVHDTDDLQIPYLPDPLADGVSFTFPDAGTGTVLSGLLAVEGTRLPYAGTWPEPVPWRLVLEAGDSLAAVADASVATVTMPAGEQLRMNLSSSLTPESLELLGLWRTLPAAKKLPIVAEAAADGWLWWLTPATQLRLVHATPRPVQAPRIVTLEARRGKNQTAADLLGAVELHGGSTDRIDVEATWTEPVVDDIARPTPQFDVAVSAVAAHTTIGEGEQLALLLGANGDGITVPGQDFTATGHTAVHQFGDTRHRLVDYRMRGSTRFREFFDPHLFAVPDDSSVAGPAYRVNVLNTARPAKPVVRDVLPLLRWEVDGEPEQPFAISRTRRSGARVYLDRPWYTTGEGELLGVVLEGGGDGSTGSQWGADPAFEQQGPLLRGGIPLSDFLHLYGLDDRVLPGRPVGPVASLPLDDTASAPTMRVLGYRPEFSAERGMWFVDVAIDPQTAFWPFVRLSVARYQPSSLPGMALSPLAQCDFVQVLPQRTSLVSRPDAQHVRVAVTGPVGAPVGGQGQTWQQRVDATRTVHARLERQVPSVGTDLGWQTVASTVLAIGGVDGVMTSWEGELELPTAIAPQRPGTDKNWRVVVEEWELLPADPSTASVAGVAAVPRHGTRVVYADSTAL